MRSDFVNDDVTPGRWNSSCPDTFPVDHLTGALLATHQSQSRLTYAVDAFSTIEEVLAYVTSL